MTTVLSCPPPFRAHRSLCVYIAESTLLKLISSYMINCDRVLQTKSGRGSIDLIPMAWSCSGFCCSFHPLSALVSYHITFPWLTTLNASHQYDWFCGKGPGTFFLAWARYMIVMAKRKLQRSSLFKNSDWQPGTIVIPSTNLTVATERNLLQVQNRSRKRPTSNLRKVIAVFQRPSALFFFSCVGNFWWCAHLWKTFH